MKLPTRQKQTHGRGEQTCGGQWVGEGEGRTGIWGLVAAVFGVARLKRLSSSSSRGKLLHLEWINHKVLMYSTRNYIQ